MNTYDFSSILSRLSSLTNRSILVAGDVMLDEFHWCHVNRISPEAPVPVCCVDRTDLVPGGAANVAHNLKVLGATPDLFGVVGTDSSGEKLIKCLHKIGLSFGSILKDPERPTTLKSRVIAHQQQVVRVDREYALPLSEALRAQFSYKLTLFQGPLDGIVISDYMKGTLTDDVLTSLINLGLERNVPVVVDPKGTQYLKYKGATVLTPNFSEFQQLVNHPLISEDQIAEEGLALIKRLHLKGLVITRSEKGATVIEASGLRTDVPTQAREVYDVTGAGDTVTAILVLALSAGFTLIESTHLANAAAGIVVGKLGTATLTLDELAHALHG